MGTGAPPRRLREGRRGPGSRTHETRRAGPRQPRVSYEAFVGRLSFYDAAYVVARRWRDNRRFGAETTRDGAREGGPGGDDSQHRGAAPVSPVGIRGARREARRQDGDPQ